MRRIATAPMILAALACAASSGAQTLAPKAVSAMLALDKAKKVLAEPLHLQTYTWGWSGPATVLPPVATHLCLLTGVTGKFAGTGELVRLYIDKGAQGGPRYMLGGQSGQLEMKVTATCVAKSQFVTAMPTQTLSEEISDVSSRSGCTAQTVPTKPSIKPSALYLAGLGGRFAGAGESVTVTSGLFGPTTTIGACSGPISAAVLAIGATPASPPVYRTTTARTTDVAAATLAYQWDHDFTSKGSPYLAPADEAFCGLTSVSGKFNGYGQYITLHYEAGKDGRRWWTLGLGYDYLADKDTAVVKAAARCYSRDQRPVG